MPDIEREMLRHLLATIGYRGRNILVGASSEAASARVHPDVRVPLEILSHMNGLLGWSRTMVLDEPFPAEREFGTWTDEVHGFFDALRELDETLAAAAEVPTALRERLVQGPLSDVLIHLGQIGILRRMAGSPVEMENYSRAVIRVGDIPHV